ncbi:MAG: fluoride efflux transporter CrcB [Rhodothermales bacterium]|nr:fluoride efflux transporter CrcB [Rhodothermales bacterium]MBO6781435.1 fluoride efflux transporter CrcB [Rhodothermales bacterium]
MANILWVASGGAIGAVLRYVTVMGVHRFAGTAFPLGTLVANVAGSLVIGILWAMAEKTPLTPAAASFLFIGLLGSFTTFATFSIETLDLFRDGRMGLAAANMLASNVLCLLAAYGGLRLGHTWA